jgi:hypothetical protein
MAFCHATNRNRNAENGGELPSSIRLKGKEDAKYET